MTAPIRDSGSMAEQITARTARRGATFDYGQITDVDAFGGVTVNLGGVDRKATKLPATPVAVGDTVLYMRQGNDLVVIGPIAVTDRPTSGTVAAVPANSYTLSVTTSAGAVDAWFDAAYTTPTVGDTVLIGWLGTQPVVLGKQGKTGAPAPPTPRPRPVTPDPPPPAPTTGRTTFTATGSGTWRTGDGWRHDAAGNVIQGTAPGFPGLNNGAWFYSGKIRSTLAGATVVSAQVWLGRVQGGNYGRQTVHLSRVAQSKRPSGNVDYVGAGASAALDIGDRGWYPLPDTLAQALIDSGGSLGIQAGSGPYVRLMGVGNRSGAGAVRINWSR